MTNKDKQAIYLELCSRLPYGINFLWDDHGGEGGNKVVKLYKIKRYGKTIDDYIFSGIGQPEPGYEYDCRINDITPYLRSMSSMTDEERKQCRATQYYSELEEFFFDTKETYDWLDKHMFDYRDLIRMGLAIEAPEEMYK